MSFSRRDRQRVALLILLIFVQTSKQSHGYAMGGTQKPQGGSSGSITHIETLMPEYQTDHAEMYLCTSVLLPDEPLKLVGVEPLSKQEVVHHMLLFGECQNPTYGRCLCRQRSLICRFVQEVCMKCVLLKHQVTKLLPDCGILGAAGCAEPAAPDKVWDCHTHSVCAEAGSHVLYGWAKGAEAMHLPAGVGFRVGQGTGSRHLVLQVPPAATCISKEFSCAALRKFDLSIVLQLSWSRQSVSMLDHPLDSME